MKFNMNLILPTLIFSVIFIFAVVADDDSGEVINFNHTLHVIDAEMACSDCHMFDGTARPLPDHDVCGNCHDVEEECGMCHKNPDEPEAMPPISGLYEGFAHAAHTKFECKNCHTIEDITELTIPGMSDCQVCHENNEGPLNCVDCHKGDSPRPMDHQLASWHKDHGLEAQMMSEECAACHDQSSCDDCHQGLNITSRPHPPGWIFNHFADASIDGSCLSCHETRQSCVTCHRSLLPIPHVLGLTYANQNGGDHTGDAAAFIETCLVCHDVYNEDPTCARCH